MQNQPFSCRVTCLLYMYHPPPPPVTLGGRAPDGYGLQQHGIYLIWERTTVTGQGLVREREANRARKDSVFFLRKCFTLLRKLPTFVASALWPQQASSSFLCLSQLNPERSSRLFLRKGLRLAWSYSNWVKTIQIGAFKDGRVKIDA